MNLKENFHIVRLAQGDAKFESDHLQSLRTLLLESESMYPNIHNWYRSKVLPGIKTSERVALVGYLSGKPVVSAVVKKGHDAKFCHLKIDDDLRNNHLGEVFFSLMALEIRDLAKDVHFTLPESLWHSKGRFFQSFNFEATRPSEVQYRLFDRELHCSAKFSDVWRGTIQKLPKLTGLYDLGGFSAENELLFSIKPEYAEKIIGGQKTVEIRRQFSTKWLKQKINIYASAPLMSLVGEATIDSIEVGPPARIWQKYSKEICCSEQSFDAYCNGPEQVFAIRLTNVRKYRAPIPLAQITTLLNEVLTPPQSYLTLENNKPWAKAVSLAAYLHGCFKSTGQICFRFRRVALEEKES